MTRLNALSNALGDSLASTSRAISTNRLWRSASVSRGFGLGGLVKVHRAFDEVVALFASGLIDSHHAPVCGSGDRSRMLNSHSLFSAFGASVRKLTFRGLFESRDALFEGNNAFPVRQESLAPFPPIIRPPRQLEAPHVCCRWQ